MPDVIVSMTEVFKLQDIADETIRAEFVRNFLTSGHSLYVRYHHIAHTDSTEVGLISFVLWAKPAEGLTVALIFVRPEWRGKGVGGQLLRFADEFAARHERALIRLEPLAQNGGPSEETLRAWYARNGYLPKKCTVEMEKTR
jgi:GNAT superfamily N-acetyltransferase